MNAFSDASTHFLIDGKALCGNEMACAGVYKDWSKVDCPRCQKLRDHDISTPLPQAPPPEPMEKREPCLHDDDKMPFGKHRGELMSEVPASYLHWLWQQRPLSHKKLENYIFNNISALKKEHPDGIWK
jgi:uncharacterized protein (DUF3820 family)